MITRITKDNADKYRALFADAILALNTHDFDGNLVTEEAGNTPIIPIEAMTFVEVELTAEEYEPGFHYKWDPEEEEWILTSLIENFSPEAKYGVAVESGEKITTLSEYFAYIVELYKINKKFTILPLEDEENFFKIDANTRVIEVPEAFKKNGISVQGDEVAEIIYFKVDRYFDAEDLGMKSAYIEWQLPADDAGERKTGFSVPYLIDANICPDHVIIGWPISSELTQIPGKIDFAVRFYKAGDEDDKHYANKLVYSLSTLPASVEIKPTLNLNIKDMIQDDSGAIDSNDLIGSRLEDTSINDVNTPDPVTPDWVDYYFLKLPQDPEEIVGDTNSRYKTYKVYLTNKETGAESDGLYIVQANITDSGRLSYNWIKREEDGEIVVDYDGGNSSTFIEVKDYENTLPEVVYYQEADELGNHAELVFNAEMPDLAAVKAAGKKAFVRVAQIILNSNAGENKKFPVLGTYQARAINRLGRKTARSFSPVALVEGPSVPEITEDFGDRAIFDKDKLTVSLEVKADTDSHAYVTYQLYRSDSKDGDYTPFKEVSRVNKFTIEGKAYSETEPEEALGDGFYYVNVSTKLNSVTTSVNGQPIRITHEASPVTIKNSDYTYSVGSVKGYDVNKPISVAITLHPSEVGKRTEEDTVTYQWYKYVSANSDQFLKDLDNAQKGLYEVTNLDEPIMGATNAAITLPNTLQNDSDFYFCCVTNTYNGTTNTKCSDFFDVYDTRDAK
jgi:hypothetical protein